MRYLLDTNVFIAAKNQHYGMDFCPGFWDWLVGANQAGVVYSVENVLDEIKNGNDELKDWAIKIGRAFFLQRDARVITAAQNVSSWASSQGYTQDAIQKFFSSADYWLISYALAYGDTVVTHERRQDGAKKRILIPNVCIGLGVSYTTPYEMLRREKARFVMA